MSKIRLSQLLAKTGKAGGQPFSPSHEFSGAGGEVTAKDDKTQTFFYFYNLPQSSTNIDQSVFQMRWAKIAEYTFNTKELSNIIHKVATALSEKPDRGIISFLNGPKGLPVWYQAAEPKLGQFDPQGLANSLWGLGKLAEKGIGVSAEFVQNWCAAAEPELGQFNPQELANSLWGLSDLPLTQKSEAFVRALWSKMQEKLPELSPAATEFFDGSMRRFVQTKPTVALAAPAQS